MKKPVRRITRKEIEKKMPPDYDFDKIRKDKDKIKAKSKVRKKEKAPEEVEISADVEAPKPKERKGTRLNKYIANAGICSRRDADVLIQDGKVKVDGNIVTTMGFNVLAGQKVEVEGKLLSKEKYVYVLLNKPKDFITTTEDTHERRTVMSLVKNACDERIYPVGRLDRMTTGLLMLTNDGELAATLTHPRYNIQKVYQVELDKPLSESDLDKIQETVELEDGKVPVDDIAILDNEGKVLGIELHIGRNRIIRRLFEHLGYRVEKLDRASFAGLTKKDLPRGKWRYLSEKELLRLKLLGNKKKKLVSKSGKK